MEDRVRRHFQESIATKQTAIVVAPAVSAAAAMMTQCLLEDGKILSCGNGGSAADSQHFSSELLNRFELERPGLPAVALTTDSSTLTSIGNDYAFADIFAKQVRALGQPADVLLAISTSGNSENVVRGLAAARERGLLTVGTAGYAGGAMAEAAARGQIDHMVVVPSASVHRIQEAQTTMYHVLWELVQHALAVPDSPGP